MTPSCTSTAPSAREPRGQSASRSCALGFASAAAVLAVLGSVHSIRPLPSYPWAAAFLFCVAWQDAWKRRIPNALTLPALLLACICAALSGGLPAALDSLAGAALAIAVLFVPFAARGMGAGDVKAAAVIGALWGPLAGLAVIFWAIVLAGLAALAWLALRGGLADLAQRWSASLGASLAVRRWVYFAPTPNSAAAGGLPFGVALGFGAATYGILGAPWLA